MNIKRMVTLALAAAAIVFSASASATTIAIIKGDFYTGNLRNQLNAQGFTVDEIDSYTKGTLMSYDAVIHYGNSYLNQDALKSYVTGGGRLIETPWFWSNFSPISELSIFNQGGTGIYKGVFPGVTVLDPLNPLLNSVIFPDAGATPLLGRTGNTAFSAGVTQVANWADGEAFIGEKSLGLGQVIGINMQVITSDAAYDIINLPWATQLLVNAIAPSAAADVPEPASIALLAFGLALIALQRHRKA